VSLCEKLEQRKLWPDCIDPDWMVLKKLGTTQFMALLPAVRRGSGGEDAVLDSTRSIVIQQAGIDRMLRKRY
jgi:hypothetical protein